VDHGSAQALIYILVVGAIVYFRLLRPVRLSAARLWVGPALLVILTIFLVWESVEGHASLPIVAGAIVWASHTTYIGYNPSPAFK